MSDSEISTGMFEGPPGMPICEFESESNSETSAANGTWDSETELYGEFEGAIMEERKIRKKALEDAIEAMSKEKVDEDDLWLGMRRCRQKVFDCNREMAESDKIVEDLEKNVYDTIELLKDFKNLGSQSQVQCAKEVSALTKCTSMRISQYDVIVEDLGKNMHSAAHLLQSYKRKRDDMQIKQKKQSESSHYQLFWEFSLSEIQRGTNNFGRFSRIGKGHPKRTHGTYLKGVYCVNLRNQRIVLRRFKSYWDKQSFQFRIEVNILRELWHSNLATPIGVCFSEPSLVYVKLPHDNLEDRIDCKDIRAPLTWKTRMRIASEICSALFYLHSRPPHGVVHGNLNPSNVLLDENDVCQLVDYGITSFLEGKSDTRASLFNLKFTVYIDFHKGSKATTWSDMYSLGMVMLKLLSGKSSDVICSEILPAVESGMVEHILDPSAGDWPIEQTRELAQLVLGCCGDKKRSEPREAALEFSRVLGSMDLVGISSEVRSRMP